jgi:anaerobic selenocysteine-containing dehydrogenase
MGERMSAMLPELIDGTGVGAVRALFVDGGNPVNALAQSGASAQAFARLKLLVSIDPFLNATSRLAHYILPPPMMLERDDIRSRDWETHTLQQPYSQFSAAVVERPAGSELIDAWRVYWEIARRTGHAIDFDGVPIDMTAAPPAETLFRILVRHSAYPAAELLAETRGRIFPSEPMFVGPRQAEPPRFQAVPTDIVEELAALAGAHRAPKALRLACRRLRDVQNSMYHDLPSIAGRVAANPLAMHPDDLAERGLPCGATVRVTSEHGEIIATAKADTTLRRGVVTLSHGWGGERGVNVNNLTSLTGQRQAINAMPILSGFDVEVRRAD